MKKIVAAIALTAGLVFVPAAAVHADVYDYLPSCNVGVNPTTPLIVPVSAECEPYTLPDGTVLNGFVINKY